MSKNNAARADTHEADPPRSLRERLQALAGTSTWREPMLGATPAAGRIPAAHMLAGALGMVGGAGSDVALDVALGRTDSARRPVREVAEAMATDRDSRACRRNRPWMRIIVWAAYVELVHGWPQPQLRPSEVTQADWALLTEAAVVILERLAEDAVAEAARRGRA